MNQRLSKFLAVSSWLCAVCVMMYHARFLLLVDYHEVPNPSLPVTLFYFVTGLGQEAFAVFLVADGMRCAAQLRAPGARARDRPPMLARVVSMYRLLVPGLLLGTILDSTGAAMFNGSGLYHRFPEFSTLTLSLDALAGNLLMLASLAVPTFGSNGMLYLLSYVFWSSVLLALFLAAKRLPGPLAWLVRIALGVVILGFLPERFLLWFASWMLGAGAMLLREQRWATLPVPTGAAWFALMLILSRLLGSDPGAFPEQLGAFILAWKYLLVGLGFALLTLAVGRHDCKRAQPDAADGAAFVFFFHFPCLMFAAAIGSDLFSQELRRQPGLASLIAFVLTVGATFALVSCFRRAVQHLLDAPPTEPQDAGTV